MKTRSLIPVLGLMLAAGSGACASADSQKTGPAESSGKSDQSLIAATGNIIAWPIGPIAWDGLVGAWPIAVWSPGLIGDIAFDVTGVTNLGVTCVGYPYTSTVITSNWLGAYGYTGVSAYDGAWPYLGTAGLYAPAYGYTGTYAPYVDGIAGYGYGAYAPWGGWTGTLWDGSVSTGWTTWLNPTLTSNAVMFTNLAALDSASYYTFNVTFTAGSTFSATTLDNSYISIFASPTTTITTSTAIPYSSIAYPILLPF